jgi:hypothetical protein
MKPVSALILWHSPRQFIRGSFWKVPAAQATAGLRLPRTSPARIKRTTTSAVDFHAGLGGAIPARWLFERHGAWARPPRWRSLERPQLGRPAAAEFERSWTLSRTHALRHSVCVRAYCQWSCRSGCGGGKLWAQALEHSRSGLPTTFKKAISETIPDLQIQ